MRDAGITDVIIGAAISVHRELGPGLLESIYEECMCLELRERGISFIRQHPIPVQYKGVPLDLHYRLDLMVERQVIVELKSVQSIDAVHVAQVLTYMKLAACPTGLLINFNVPVLKAGLRRLVLSSVVPAVPAVLRASAPQP